MRGQTKILRPTDEPGAVEAERWRRWNLLSPEKKGLDYAVKATIDHSEQEPPDKQQSKVKLKWWSESEELWQVARSEDRQEQFWTQK